MLGPALGFIVTQRGVNNVHGISDGNLCVLEDKSAAIKQKEGVRDKFGLTRGLSIYWQTEHR